VRGEPRRPRSRVTDDSTQAVPHHLQLTLSIEYTATWRNTGEAAVLAASGA